MSILLGLLVGVMVTLGACGGSSTDRSSTTSTSMEPDAPTTMDPLAPASFTDPSQPVSVGLGRRFELLLPADPTRGWRWVLEPVDTTRVVPLSSEFSDDPDLLASTSTTTTTAAGGVPTATQTPLVTWEATTTTTLDPDAPELAPLVQIMLFAGRSIGSTEIRLRYEQIGGTAREHRTVTFTVSVHANAD